jgi:hypothetical protein
VGGCSERVGGGKRGGEGGGVGKEKEEEITGRVPLVQVRLLCPTRALMGGEMVGGDRVSGEEWNERTRGAGGGGEQDGGRGEERSRSTPAHPNGGTDGRGERGGIREGEGVAVSGWLEATGKEEGVRA